MGRDTTPDLLSLDVQSTWDGNSLGKQHLGETFIIFQYLLNSLITPNAHMRCQTMHLVACCNVHIPLVSHDWLSGIKIK